MRVKTSINQLLITSSSSDTESSDSERIIDESLIVNTLPISSIIRKVLTTQSCTKIDILKKYFIRSLKLIEEMQDVTHKIKILKKKKKVLLELDK